MIQQADEVLSRIQIAPQIWEIHFDSDTNVDDFFREKLIHTLRGVGYVLERQAVP